MIRSSALWDIGDTPPVTDPSKEGLMHQRTVNCSEMFTGKFDLDLNCFSYTAKR